MKILHVVYNSHPDTTGAAVRTRYLVQAQARLGVKPVVLSAPFQPPADPGQSQGVEHFDGVPYYRCYNGADPGRFMAAKPWWERAMRVAAFAGFVRRIRQVARAERVDLIHVHNLFFCGLAAAAAARSLGLPVVYEVRSVVEEGMDGLGAIVRRACRLLETLACYAASHVTVLCNGLREELIDRGVRPEKITVSGNGVDIEAHRPEPSAPREAFVIGYIGTLAAYEGVDVLLDAVALVNRRQPQVRLMLIGNGPARKALEQQVRLLGLERVVEFTGRVPHDDIGRYYRAIDLFVLPRPQSRLADRVTPLKPLEIMAHGKPLLASDCGGHRELIVKGVNGVLFPGQDHTVLAKRIERMMADPNGLAALGSSAREWVSRYRTWESQCRPVVELYEKLARPEVVLVAPAPGAVPTGGVETGVAMLLGSRLARRIHLWDRRRRRFLRFAAFVAVRQPRVIHVKSSSGTNFVESALFAAIGRALGRRVLFQIHSGDFEHWYRERGRLGRWGIRMGLRVPSELLALSESWRTFFSGLVPDRPVRVAPNGVEIPASFSAARSRNGSLRVLTIATLGEHKGHFDILAAADRLRECSIRFTLAGPDSTSGRGEGEQVRRCAEEMGLLDQVEFIGPVGAREKWDLLAAADVFLLPSKAEGMPNAVLEAMAAELPVIATSVGAMPEMLPDGVLVPAGDVDGLTAALLDLLASPDRRFELGRRNRERAESCYSFDRVVRQLEALYS